MVNEGAENKGFSKPDKELGKADCYIVIFLVEHFRIVREELKIDHKSFIFQVINIHWLYNKVKVCYMIWNETWKNIESKNARKTLRKKKLLTNGPISGIIYNEEFANFRKKYLVKFAKKCENFILDLDTMNKKIFLGKF